MTQQILAEHLVPHLESALDRLFLKTSDGYSSVDGRVIIDACHRAVANLGVPRDVVENALLALAQDPRHFNPTTFAQAISVRLSVDDTVGAVAN